MNKEDFRRFGHEFVDWIADYFERVEDFLRTQMETFYKPIEHLEMLAA